MPVSLTWRANGLSWEAPALITGAMAGTPLFQVIRQPCTAWYSSHSRPWLIRQKRICPTRMESEFSVTMTLDRVIYGKTEQIHLCSHLIKRCVALEIVRFW